MVLQPALAVEIEPTEGRVVVVATAAEYVAGSLCLYPGVVLGPHEHDRRVRTLLPSTTVAWWDNANMSFSRMIMHFVNVYISVLQ